MFRNPLARFAATCGGWVGVAAAHNTAYPLEVVWDLDETLVSSERRRSSWRPDQANQVLRLTDDEVEHVDDDALHFVTMIRPHAATVLRGLRALPGCRQSVSTAASPGYAANVVQLLEKAAGDRRRTDASRRRRGGGAVRLVPADCSSAKALANDAVSGTGGEF